MARPKIKGTEERTVRAKKSQERIAAYFDWVRKRGITQQKVAEEWGLSLKTLGNYIHGRSYISQECADIFEEHTQILAGYWRGLTDHKTEKEMLEEWAIVGEDENAANDPNIEEQHQRDLENKSFFARCGFSYTDLLIPPGPFEFTGLHNPSESMKSYRLTSISDPSLSADFTETELEGVFSRLQDTLHSLIELECYRKKKAPCNDIQDASASK